MEVVKEMAKIIIEYDAHEYYERVKQDTYNVPYLIARAVDTLISNSKKAEAKEIEEVSEEYEKFLNWCEDKWALDYKWEKLLSKLSNNDKDFLKDQYEARLKADMVAMLEELKGQLREKHEDYFESEYFDEACGVLDSVNVIQQKINTLEEKER